MWVRRILLALALTAALATGSRDAGAVASFGASVYATDHGVTDVSFFYSSLAPYGHWMTYASYGEVWRPVAVPYGWRPYSYGSWVYTDYGWTWVATEPWGWAPYHYGRWVFDPIYGWLWVPGTVWAPAWVTWSYSDDWIGWAPLPPAVSWSATYGLGPTYAVRDIGYSSWAFVPRASFLDAHLNNRLVPTARNRWLLDETRVYTRMGERGGLPVNTGYSVRSLEQRLGRSIPRYSLRDVNSPRLANTVRGRNVSMFKPRIEESRSSDSPRARNVIDRALARERDRAATALRSSNDHRRVRSAIVNPGRLDAAKRRTADAGQVRAAMERRQRPEQRRVPVNAPAFNRGRADRTRTAERQVAAQRALFENRGMERPQRMERRSMMERSPERSFERPAPPQMRETRVRGDWGARGGSSARTEEVARGAEARAEAHGRAGYARSEEIAAGAETRGETRVPRGHSDGHQR